MNAISNDCESGEGGKVLSAKEMHARKMREKNLAKGAYSSCLQIRVPILVQKEQMPDNYIFWI